MFKIIFVILLVLIFVPSVRRFLFWLIVGRQIVKEQKKYQQPQRKVRPEGEIKVDYVPPGKDQNSNNSDGQYIDYEEVK